eukprot:43537-Eustigmatos_ZCMA.PRE.1
MSSYSGGRPAEKSRSISTARVTSQEEASPPIAPTSKTRSCQLSWPRETGQRMPLKADNTSIDGRSVRA